MRARMSVALCTVLALAPSGCLQPSLNALLLPQDMTFDARLLGTWKSGAAMWTFAQMADDDALELFENGEEVDLTKAGAQ